jgi:RHS repeat-associated protein
MIFKFRILCLLCCVSFALAQNPATINLNSVPTNYAVDSYTRATQKINLTPGFKYGPTTSASNLLNLSIGSYASNVNNSYTDTSNTYITYINDPNLIQGVTEGEPSVSPIGSFNYQIPVFGPPGMSSAQPNLTIVYNNNNGVNNLGLGFSLSGISAISRTNKSIYFDGVQNEIKMNPSDVFAIDGERLLLSSGVYGQNGATYQSEVNNYSKIFSYGTSGSGPTHFIIHTPDGKTIEFGNTSDSKLKSLGNGLVLAWYVSKVTDEYGNYMTFHYDNNNGEINIIRIEYSGNAAQGLVPYNKMEFEYFNNRSDSKTIFVGGEVFKQTKLLKSIISKNESNNLVRKYNFAYQYSNNSLLHSITEIDANNNQLNPTYFDWNKTNLITNTSNVGFLPPSAIKIASEMLTTSGVATDNLTTISADMNGDGKKDLITLNCKQITISTPLPTTFKVFLSSFNQFQMPFNDFQEVTNTSLFNSKELSVNYIEILGVSVLDEDDDNIEEVYITSRTPNTNFYFIHKIKSDGINYNLSLYQNLTPISITNPLNPFVNNWRYSSIYSANNVEVSKLSRSGYNITSAVIDQDNQLDLISIDQNFIKINLTKNTTIINYPISDVIKTKLGDFNGDGIADIYLLKAVGINCSSPGQTLSSAEVIVLSYNESTNNLIQIANFPINNGVIEYNVTCNDHQKLISFFENLSNSIDFGDFNGDGKTDILYNKFLVPFSQNNNPGSAELRVAYSDGLNFLFDIFLANLSTSLGGNTAAFFASDLNQDGFCDWALTSYNSSTNKSFYSYYVSNGSGVNSVPNLFSRFLKYGASIGDFDGDGTTDMIGQIAGNTPITIEYNVFRQNNRRLLTSIKNIKSEYKIDYSILVNNVSISNYPLYRKTSSTNSSNYKIARIPYFVVKRSTLNNISTDYAYENSLFDRNAKGNLGFEKFYSIDVASGIMSIDSYTYNPVQNFVNQTEKIQGLKNVGIGFPQINPTSLISKNKVEFTFVMTGKSRYLASTLSNQKSYLSSTNTYVSTVFDPSKDGSVSSTSSYNSSWNGSTVLNGQTEYFLYVPINNPISSQTIYKIQQHTKDKIALVSGNTQVTSFVNNFSYDAAGHMISKNENIQTPSKQITTNFSNFNNFGSPGQIVTFAADLATSRGNQFMYDPTGRFVIKSINSIGFEEEATYETKFGNKISTKDITGLISTFEYDGLGRLIKTITPNNAVNILKYEWHLYNLPSTSLSYYGGKVTTLVEGNPTLVKKYNNNELLLETSQEIFGGANHIVKYEYNNSNKLIKQSELATINPLSGDKIVEYTYDSFLRTKSITNKIGNNVLNVIDYSYNNLSNETTYVKGFVQIKAPNSNTGQFIFVKKENDEAGRNDKTINSSNVPGNSHSSEIKFNEHGKPYLITNSFSGSLSSNISINYDALGRQQQLTDPSAGTSTYQYNSLGELLNQTTPNGSYNFSYDQLGRIVTKSSGSNNYSYSYVNSGNGKQMIKQVVGPNETIEYAYDNLNRIIEKKQTLTTSGNKILKSNYSYDKYGNVINYTYPGNFVITNEYDNLSNLIKVKNGNNILWELTSLYTPDLIEQFKTGNGIYSNSINYDVYHNISQKNFGSLLQQHYTISQKNGDLMFRKLDQLLSSVSNNEQFSYDQFNRLTETKYLDPLNTLQPKATVSYFANGNINSKSDAGDYIYGQSSSPYQLTQINNAQNNISINTLNVFYNDFKKVSQITEATSNKQFNFVYGNDEERIKMEYSVNGVNQYTRYYTDNYDRQENADGSFKEWSYIYTPTGLTAVHYNNNGTTQLLFTETDHLGSPLVVANSSGAILEQYSFDAWGRLRNPSDWNDYHTNITSNYMIRGYTGHEMLGEVGIINMNGRIYDPVLGRFLQPDNFVQAPEDLQNFNRYSYVLNNPLKYNDPSGELIGLVFWPMGILTNALGNLIEGGYSNVFTAAYQQTKDFNNQIASATQISIFNNGNTQVTAGLNIFAMGISLGVSHKEGDFTYGGMIGIGTGGFFASGSVGYQIEGGFGANIGISATGNSFGYGGSVNFNGIGAGYYRTHYGKSTNNPTGKPNQQIVGGVSIFGKNWSVRGENDFFSGAGGDRWRTGAMEVTVNKFSVGFTVYTNDPLNEYGENDYNYIEKSEIYGHNNRKLRFGRDKAKGTWNRGMTYESPVWFGYNNGFGVSRIGYSHPYVQDSFQNGIHKFVPPGSQNFYNKYSPGIKHGYHYSGFNNPYSLYGN